MTQRWRPWNGRNDAGPREPKPGTEAKIMLALNTHPDGMSLEELSAEVGVEGRALREAISRLDGVVCVFALEHRARKDYIKIARCQSEAKGFTVRLAGQAKHMRERVERRTEMAKRLPGGLFEEEAQP